MELKLKHGKEHEHIFRSKLPDISIPTHLSLPAYCFQNLSSHRARPYLIDAATGVTITHAEFELAARRAAAGFHGLGIRKSDVVMLLLHNSPEFAVAFLGASIVGAVPTTVNPLYTASEIALQARISRPALVITHASFVGNVKQYATESGAKIATIDLPLSPEIIHFAELMRSDEKLAPQVEIDGDNTAALPFSSGTTGLPKGVMLSHKNLVTCISQQLDGENQVLHTECEDRVLCVLPMFHAYCMISVMLCCLRAGAAAVILPKFEITQLMEVLEKYRVTIAPLVPPILLRIAKSPAAAKFDLSSVRRVSCGAAPMDGGLELALKSKLPNAIIGQSYGMTEGGVISICLGFAKFPLKFKAGACGSVLPNATMKIIDPFTGISLPRNQTGEICTKGDAVMKGYYNNPEATKEAIDEEGWLHTGDLGYVDEDGEVFVVDRLKELIKYKGFQVAPAELEALLLTHPSISDAAVVPMAHEGAGQVPVAFVVRANNAAHIITEQEIKHYVSKQVAPYKRIYRVFFIDTIPKAPTGKILRKYLRARL